MSAAIDDLRSRVERAERAVAAARRPLSEGERTEVAVAQARADAVERAFGRNDASVLGRVAGESPLAYRQRLLRNYTKYSPQFKGVRTEALGYDVIGFAEDQIYADALAAANDSASYPPGTLRAVKFRDEAGRECTRFVGDNSAWMSMFQTGGQVGFIRRDLADQARYGDR